MAYDEANILEVNMLNMESRRMPAAPQAQQGEQGENEEIGSVFFYIIQKKKVFNYIISYIQFIYSLDESRLLDKNVNMGIQADFEEFL